uniref:hypothetical protein n=1 Tax=Hericium alpestre TaxID=135208 RepID=UPI002435F562|nr:hypothetical protein QEO35_mgp29 [Hericium alpestre]WEX32004.1 hypothetical protein [Hericium alpestre]
MKNYFKAWGFNRDDSNVTVSVNQGSDVDQAISQAQVANENIQASQAASHAASATSSQNLDSSNISNNFLSDGNPLDDISNNLLNGLMDYLKPFLEPVQVSYSNELLANQIYGISIMLYILSVILIVLLTLFIINIIIFIYSDKIMNYFTNKYIRRYININKKFIGIELFLLAPVLIHFMYILSTGILFIATHPITFS